MFNARRASISGCVAAVLAGGFLFPLEAQQPPATPSVPSVINRYCVSCHNGRLKSGALALVDRYGSAAEKVTRIAIGRRSVSPGGDTIRVQTDLTQEEHPEGLPIGTRGGALVHYTFPLDGEYEIQIRLTRDRNEHVEGLSEAHDLEVLLDRERVQLFTVRPPKGAGGSSDESEPSHDTVDQHLKARMPMK